MKLEIGRNELLTALQAVTGVVERRQTLPVLSNLLLEATSGELVVTGTDLEIELVARAVIRSGNPGRTTVPARKLFDICRGLPEGAEIRLEAQPDRVTLKSGTSRYTLSALRPEEFPALGTVAGNRKLSVTRRDLRRLIDRTQFAMASQDVRYYLNGMLLHVGARHIRTVATDGHRLAVSELSGDTSFKEEVQVILPRKAVLELHRLLDGREEPVELRIGEGHFQADLDVIRLTCKLIDGRFPDYERVIPEANDQRLQAGREQVRQALARAAVLSNEKFRGVRLVLADSRLKLQTHNPEHEEAEEELEVSYSGTPLEIGFNVNYLMDALAVMETEEFTMDLKNAESSGLIQEVAGSSSRYVVMPMRL